jgi:formylglycine-generating enzyme required for sulfatase activity
MSRRLLPVLLLSTVVAGLLPAWGQAPRGKKYALLVGVTRYRHARLPDLKYTERDVEDLARLLRGKTGRFDKVTLLTTSRAARKECPAPTAANIRAALQKLMRDKGKDDLVLVALAGHGVQLRVKDGKRERDEAFFCPSDAQINDPERLISLKRLFDDLNDCGAAVKFLLVDACRNDPREARNLDVDTLPRPPRGIGALFSCASGQRAFETAKLGGGHGVFFHFVLEGLRGKARDEDGAVTWDDLTKYVRRQVSRQVPRVIGGGARQSPHAMANFVGEPPVLLAADNETPRAITNSLKMKLVLIPAGKFKMGSPAGEKGRNDDEHQHEVEITRPFYMGVHTVTVGQFRQFVDEARYRTEAERGAGGYGYNRETRKLEGGKRKYSWRETGWKQSDRHPVVNVSFNDAVAFCAWLSKKERRTYRLPTEAQWEYACRAGTTTRFWSGAADNDLRGVANLADQALKEKYPDASWAVPWNDGHPFTAPVGSFKANPWGLYEMNGNVWQWCSDFYDKDYYKHSPKRDPQGPEKATRHLVRGGSWFDNANCCRSAFRSEYDPRFRSDVGFRVVCATAPRTP